MGVLKRKEERTETITVRVPASVKAEFDRLRERADAAGFDLGATRTAKQIREELDADERKGAGRHSKANGIAAAANGAAEG
jgi:hypothetical protein